MRDDPTTTNCSSLQALMMTTLHAHRRLSTCHLHPTSNPIIGFCASCLRERLSTIEDSVTTTTTTNPRLRRTKSYSSTDPPNANAASTSEPYRKSCDVGPHHAADDTLSNLLSLETKRRDPIDNPVLVLKDEDEDEDGEFRTMKEFIDLELESIKTRFSFWESAASCLSKKLLKWKQKQQRKNKKDKEGFAPEKAKVVTQSEIGLYGRRSCDTDPRLSVDNGRYSFDKPRASWDGYLIGKAYPRLFEPPMPMVDEKDKEKESEGEKSPGGSEQTRDYYGEPLSSMQRRRRRSFDKSASVKRLGFVVDDDDDDDDEVDGISSNKLGIANAKVSPETVGLFHGAKLLVTEKELRDSNWYSVKDYHAQCVESDFKNVVGGDKNSMRRQNLWNMWGLIQKRNDVRKNVNGGKANLVEEPLVQKLKRVANGEANGTVSERLIRSYSVSARNSFQMDGSSNGVEAKENGGRKKHELVLQRNRSTAYSSPSNLDNGLLRFYLTPVRNYRRSKSGRSGVKNLQSIAMTGL